MPHKIEYHKPSQTGPMNASRRLASCIPIVPLGRLYEHKLPEPVCVQVHARRTSYIPTADHDTYAPDPMRGNSTMVEFIYCFNGASVYTMLLKATPFIPTIRPGLNDANVSVCRVCVCEVCTFGAPSNRMYTTDDT